MQDDFKEGDGIEAVHEAFRLGINFFDTSPLYGKTKSETVRTKPSLHEYAMNTGLDYQNL